MTLKAVVSPEEFHALGEPLRAQYVQRDGRYFLDVIAVTYEQNGKETTLAVENVGDPRLALSRARTTARELTKQLKAFDGIDDPQAAINAMAMVREWENASPDARLTKQLETSEQQLESQFRAKIEALKDRIAAKGREKERLAAEIDRLVIDSAASNVLRKLGVLPEAQEYR